METLRIIFMGTPQFAVPSLNTLLEAGYNVVAVITAPDKPKGRGQEVGISPVKEVALRQGIPVLQPPNLKAPQFITELEAYNANLQVVVAFRMLPEIVWKNPAKGTFNLHASLLPKYRGAAPIHWAIINGEKETGVTTFFLKHQIDTGNIVLQESEPIHQNDTMGTLSERLMYKGAELVLKTVQMIEEDTVILTPQDLSIETPQAPKLFKEHCEINWKQPAKDLVNFIRGLNPFPVAWTKLGQTKFKIYAAEALSFEEWSGSAAGAYVTDGSTYLKVQSGDGVISIKELQAPGKRRMSIEEFLRGNSL